MLESLIKKPKVEFSESELREMLDKQKDESIEAIFKCAVNIWIHRPSLPFKVALEMAELDSSRNNNLHLDQKILVNSRGKAINVPSELDNKTVLSTAIDSWCLYSDGQGYFVSKGEPSSRAVVDRNTLTCVSEITNTPDTRKRVEGVVYLCDIMDKPFYTYVNESRQVKV